MAHNTVRRVVVGITAVLALTIAGCGSDSADPDDGSDDTQVVDVAAVPESVTWTPYQGVSVPYSSIDGPTTGTVSAAPTGYSHTPQGAILAAIQAQTRLALAPDSSWPQVTAALVAPGAGRDAYATARAGASITSAADPATTAAFAGFRVRDYTDDTAVVDIATTMPGGQLTSVPATVLWRGDDWKLLLPDPSSDDSDIAAPADTDPAELPSLDGFTSFSAS
ncbi:hypothetical protein BH93_27470 (plasmid) [Rhodococcoides fascians A25f]|uniref:hypothetical protein n=1 Tax=Rhodococcoides fascians TaxID=1828 RepID=UPI000689FEB9|nr:hypothetical protein [Rhodococcus fascians]QII09312.1 hypothetical protein BH93_27470 [Rhodococcus fascians A25f]